MYTLPGRTLADIPVIETSRLRLRANRLDDYDSMFAMWQDPKYYRFIGNSPRSSGQIWGNLQSSIGSWALFGIGYLTIADRHTDQHMGECGFAITRRAEIDPPLPLIPEAGWGIRTEHWGQGYMKEAMLGFLDWAVSQDSDFPCQCIINNGHSASESVAKALGMSILRTVEYNGNPDDLTNVWQRRPQG